MERNASLNSNFNQRSYAHNINATTDLSCGSCHTGTSGFASGKDHYKNASGVAIHMTTTAECSTCHKDINGSGALVINNSSFKFTPLLPLSLILDVILVTMELQQQGKPLRLSLVTRPLGPISVCNVTRQVWRPLQNT